MVELLWISTLSLAGRSKSSYTMVSARPDSPGPDVSNTIIFMGETMLSANSTVTKASQPKIAVFR